MKFSKIIGLKTVNMGIVKRRRGKL